MGPGGSDLPDDIHNYMGYALDLCWTRFTPGQYRRMRWMTFEMAPQLTTGDGRTIPVNQSILIPANHRWEFRGATLQMGIGSLITVDGDLTASSTQFVGQPLNVTYGWGGIHYRKGSTGLLQAGSAVQNVGGSSTRAITVTNASPLFRNVGIGSPSGSAVTGLYVTGPLAYPEADQISIGGMTNGGIVLNDRASLRLRGSEISENVGAGIAAGYRTRLFIYGDLVGDGDILESNAERNTTDGLQATAMAEVVLGRSLFAQSGDPLDGFTSWIRNNASGVLIKSDSVLYGGGTTSWQRNRLFENSAWNALADGKDTRAYLRCNWWGQSMPPFGTTAQNDAVLDNSWWLTEDPYINPQASCITGSDGLNRTAGRVTTPSQFGGGSPMSLSDSLAQALALGDDPVQMFVSLVEIIQGSPGEPEAAAALAETAPLAAKGEITTDALALLNTMASQAPNAVLQATARRSLIRAHHARGDLPAALAAADALIASPVGSDDIRVGQAARVYLLAESDLLDEALAALAALEVTAPGSTEAVLARAFIDGMNPGGQSLTYVHEPLEFLPASKSGATALSVRPNPARGSVTATFMLSDAAQVRLTLHDVLGRTLWTSTDDLLPAGPQEISFGVTHLSPGVYVVRLRTGDAVSSQTLTVTR